MSVYRKGERVTSANGTLDYNTLSNIPKVNGTEVKGSVTLSAGCILEVDSLPLSDIDQTKLYKQGDVISWWNGTSWLAISGSASTSSSLGEDLFPVGSIYISYTNTSPEGIFGGTWTQITDCFLIGKGNAYNETAVTGSATKIITPSGTNSEPSVTMNSITLDTTNMPNHTHTLTASGTVACTTAATFSGNGNYLDTGNESYGVTDNGHSHSYTYMVTNKHNNSTNTVVSSSENNTGYWSHNTSYTTPSISVSSSGNHTHTYTASGSISGGQFTFTGTSKATDQNGSGTAFTPTASSTTAPTFKGTAESVSVLPPYLVVYVWKRVS